MKQTVTPEEFKALVDILENRGRHLLLRETRVGHGSHVSGNARMQDDEFRRRLARLRDHTGGCMAELRQLSEEQPELVKHAPLTPHIKAVENAMNRTKFAGLQKRTIYGMLMQLRDGAEDLLDLLTVEFTAMAERIDPNCPMDLLTPDEIETAFQDVPQASLLAKLRSFDYELRSTLNETMALIKGRFGPSQRQGPYEKRRGRWITAQMFGMAEGLGLLPTRNLNPQPHASLHSAADAVAIAIGRMRETQSEQSEHIGMQVGALRDPAECAVLAEMPVNQGREINPKAVADNIIRKVAQSDEDFITEARSAGRQLGQRESSKMRI